MFGFSRVKSIAAAAVAIVVLAGAAQAATVTLSSVSGQFLNPTWNYGYQKRSNVSDGDVFVRDGLGSEIWWGNFTPDWLRTAPLTSEEIRMKKQSGYVFHGIDSEDDFETSDERFVFGRAEHYNGAIWSNSASLHSVDFKLDILGTLHGALIDLSVTVRLGHSETINPAATCAKGGSNPCRDAVAIGDVIASSIWVEHEGREYSLELEGLVPGLDGDVITEFFTPEYQMSSAMFRARVIGRDLPPPPPPPEVPLPAAAWLMLAGLGSLVAVARARKRA